jgi:guanylate kinase
MTKGPLIILSGPAGSGKTTVVSRVIESATVPLRRTVSATTRQPRPGEVHGRDYYFVTAQEFEAKLRDGLFLEHALVHDHSYGTLRSEVDPYRARGCGVILVIDVQGAAKVRAQEPDNVSVFLLAPTDDDLERRLRERGQDSEAAIRRRLANAQAEVAQAPDYTYQVVNDDLERTVAELRKIIEAIYARR